MAINRIDENIAVVHSLSGLGAVVQFSSRESLQNHCHKISYKGSKNGIQLRHWGKNNDLPQYREQIIGENNIVPALIQSKRDITFGTGLFAYKPVFKSDEGKFNIEEVEMPLEARDFFEENDIDDYLIGALAELFKHANVFTEFVMLKGGKVGQIMLHECKNVRLGEQNAQGIVENAYISGSWPTGSTTRKEGETASDRIIHGVPLYRKGLQQAKFMLHTGDRLLNDGYYNSPSWWSGRDWVELSNAIPQFHKANIRNGYTIRFHIEIPKGYFYTDPQTDAADLINKAKSDAENKKAEFLKQVNDLLAGTEGTGRALFTEYTIQEALGKEYPGIRITPINVDIKDQALLALFEKSNTANISAQGIHPTLANIETQGRLSSGSEIRNAFIMYLAIRTPIPRRIILKAINLVKQLNGWPKDIFYAFGDTTITTLDESKSGQQDAAVIPEKPTDE